MDPFGYPQEVNTNQQLMKKQTNKQKQKQKRNKKKKKNPLHIPKKYITLNSTVTKFNFVDFEAGGPVTQFTKGWLPPPVNLKMKPQINVIGNIV